MGGAMLNERVRRVLEQNWIDYETVPHREAFTAQGVAAATHVSGWQMAKVLIARDENKRYVMIVLPASCRADLATLRRVTGRPHLELAAEEEIASLFPDCELGAMPPFGNLYGLEVYVDACFPRNKPIAFQAGNHHEVVKIAYPDYQWAVKPFVTEFCRH